MNLNQHYLKQKESQAKYATLVSNNCTFQSAISKNEFILLNSIKQTNNECVYCDNANKSNTNLLPRTILFKLLLLISIILLTKLSSILICFYLLNKLKLYIIDSRRNYVNSTGQYLTILLIKLKSKLFSNTTSRLKTFLIVILFLPTLINYKTLVLAQQINSTTNNEIVDEIAATINKIEFDFKIYDCNEDANDEINGLKFDLKLFYELNMHETILNLYKSCFREDLIKMKTYDYDEDNSDNYKNDYNSNKNDNNIDEILFCRKQKKFEEILNRLINFRNDIIPENLLNRIQLVCNNNNNNNNNNQIKINLYDKLYLLSSYEHDLCGNIFRNSMKRNYLNDDVLKLKQIKKQKTSTLNDKLTNQVTTPTTTTTTTTKENVLPVLDSTNLEFKYLLKNFDSIDTSQVTLISSTRKIDNFLPFATIPVKNFTENKNFSKRGMTLQSNSFLNTTMKEINNCTLILLNTYLLAYKSSCDNRDFVTSLNHYDCASNNFSVKSNCKLCQEAYAKWLCSSNIPYYDNGKLAKPCQRYCFNVQNLCPFFRPMDDSFGAQPLFHCRNVVQVSEERPEGYEDDDEHYYEDETNDDDKCYSECTGERKKELIQTDLDLVFKENLHDSVDSDPNFSLLSSWKELKTQFSKSDLFYLMNDHANIKYFNKNARYSHTTECIFNSVSSSASHSIDSPIVNNLTRSISEYYQTE